jgi:hypothetical protein
MRTLLFYLCFTCSSVAWSQGTFVYPNDQLRWNEAIVHIDGGLVRAGNDWRGEVLFTVQGDQIFEGYSTSSFDLLYTVRDGQLCRGDSHFSQDVLYTLAPPGIYIGDSTFLLDQVYNVRDEPLHHGEVMSVYRDDSGSVFDRVCSIQGSVSPAAWFALMLAQNLL